MTTTTILICDDSVAIHASLTPYLKAANMNVISLYDGRELLDILKKKKVDLIILDIMLPYCFGTEICIDIRKFSNVPIIFLTAKADEEDRILGLEIGADDYVTKPFSPREVVARVFTILKRTSTVSKAPMQQFANLMLNPDSFSAKVNEQPLTLTPKEFSVLMLLITNAEKVLNRDYILDEIWGHEYYGDTRSVDTIIKRLRKKLSAANAGCRIRSIYGIGYQIDTI